MPTVAKLKLAAADRGPGVQWGGVGTLDCGGVLKAQGHPYGGTTLAIARARFRVRGVGLGASSGSADRQSCKGVVSRLCFDCAKRRASRCHSRILRDGTSRLTFRRIGLRSRPAYQEVYLPLWRRNLF